MPWMIRVCFNPDCANKFIEALPLDPWTPPQPELAEAEAPSVEAG